MPTIVLIDDDRDFTSLVSELLSEHGWHVTVCSEEDDAVRCVAEAKPDLIILDVRMRTRESGWHILKRLDAEPALRQVPVIVCSAAVDDLRQRAGWMGVHGIHYLVKPFDIDDLLTMIQHRLGLNGDPPHTVNNDYRRG
ncbi:MAG TPA: response regulator [Chloroflexota bacterium]|nr:response regulator [Chloroflexota bacterium]